jgi:uncharacterized cupredoxin-like copper-binding protein
MMGGSGGMMGGAGMMGGSGGMMGGAGMMGGGGGMMGGTWSANQANGPQPGEAGFVAGTVAVPRMIRVIAGPGYTFSPSAITVVRGETIAFQVTTMGPATHEFMVGPAGAVAADQEGTPEVADIGMMQTRSLTFTFEGDGPYAYACHAPGHYEAGMRGAVTVVSL